MFPNTTRPYSNIGETFDQRSIGATATADAVSTASRPPTGRVRPKARSWARARRLRVTEQQVLLDAATAYMNLLRDGAILELNRSNVEVLTEQLKQTRDRFNVGEVTRTDVAQAESRLAAGRSALLGAQSNFVTSQANYRRMIGVDPGHARARHAGRPAVAPTLPKAIAQGQAQSPSVLAAMYGVDVAELAVKISEGALYPNLSVAATALQGWTPGFETLKETAASVVGTLTIPIYQGGARVFGYPAVQGNAGAAASQARRQSRPGARHRGAKLGTARCREGPDRSNHGAG